MPQTETPVLAAYLTVHDCNKASQYYQSVFDATENMRFEMPDGKIGHLNMTIGNSQLMLADAFPEMGFNAPEKFGGSPAAMHLYVDDCDATMKKAVAA